mgnify:CR=1 FL=1
MEQLHAAIAALPDKQAKRIYAYYFLGLTESAIAKSEGVSVASVSESIQRGLGTWRLSLKSSVTPLKERLKASRLLEGHAILVTSRSLKTE